MKRILILLGLTILIAGCNLGKPEPPTHSATHTHTAIPLTKTTTIAPTQTQTPTPSITFTPSITPAGILTSHEWVPENILIYYNHWGGDGCCANSEPPHIVLYSDGQLFVYKSGFAADGPLSYLLTTQLSRKEMCALLNTIEQLGFFNYDYGDTTYNIEGFSVEGGSEYIITVNSWHSNSISILGLWEFVNHGYKNEPVQTSPSFLAIKDTFELLFNYAPEGLRPYKPDYIELWIYDPYDSKDIKPWPPELPPLRELLEQAQPDEFYDYKLMVLLEGETANQISQLFEYLPKGGLFSDGDITLTLVAIPLLPYPHPSHPFTSRVKLHYQATPTPSKLNCEVSDGLLPLP